MQFGLVNVVVRWLFTLGVMFGAYNPSGRSYVHWVLRDPAPRSLQVFVGCLIVTAFLVLGGAAIRALGYPGLVVLATLMVLFAGTVVQLGLIDLGDRTEVVLAVQALAASGLTLGLCWSALRARLSGQVDSDDVSRRI